MKIILPTEIISYIFSFQEDAKYLSNQNKIISLLKLHKCLKNPIIQYNYLKYTRVLKIKNSKKRYLLSCIWFFHSSQLICYHDVILYNDFLNANSYTRNLNKYLFMEHYSNKRNEIVWDIIV